MVEFGFKFGTFWLPSLCLFHSGICVLGRKGDSGWSNSVLTESLYPQVSLPSSYGGVDWAEGRGVEGKVWSTVEADGESSAWHLFANSFSLHVPDLWMFSWPRSCPSKRPAGMILFSGITQGGWWLILGQLQSRKYEPRACLVFLHMFLINQPDFTRIFYGFSEICSEIASQE